MSKAGGWPALGKIAYSCQGYETQAKLFFFFFFLSTLKFSVFQRLSKWCLHVSGTQMGIFTSHVAERLQEGEMETRRMRRDVESAV